MRYAYALIAALAIGGFGCDGCNGGHNNPPPADGGTAGSGGDDASVVDSGPEAGSGEAGSGEAGQGGGDTCPWENPFSCSQHGGIWQYTSNHEFERCLCPDAGGGGGGNGGSGEAGKGGSGGSGEAGSGAAGGGANGGSGAAGGGAGQGGSGPTAGGGGSGEPEYHDCCYKDENGVIHRGHLTTEQQGEFEIVPCPDPDAGVGGAGGSSGDAGQGVDDAGCTDCEYEHCDHEKPLPIVCHKHRSGRLSNMHVSDVGEWCALHPDDKPWSCESR